MRPDPIAEEAARWRLRVEAGTADPQALSRWLGDDPEHGRSLGRVESVWSLIDTVRDDPRLRQIGQSARRRVRMRARRKVAIQLAVAASIAGVCVLLEAWPNARTYENDTRERKVVALSDGSTVTLDAMSKVVTRFTPLRRELALAQGEARFDVAHSAWRRFVVTAGPRRIVATGTVFDVDLAGGSLNVRLLQGAVKVLPLSSVSVDCIPAEVRLKAGQQLDVQSCAQQVTSFDAATAAAWMHGRLVFDGTPLRVAAARHNRYSVNPIVFADPQIGDLKISGVFNSGDTTSFAEAAAAVLPLDVVAGSDGSVVLSRRN